MDIFDWLRPVLDTLYEGGEERLVRQLVQLPNRVVNDDHEFVDGAIPELLAGVQRLKNPWLEVFVRHWDLQSRILKRNDVAEALHDAVYLLDFASRPEARDCPQSICAVQDFAAGYGIADGPGFAVERLEVSRETLDRIDASWPCFRCISSEHADALMDQGRPDDALDFLDAQDRAANQAGKPSLEVDDTRINALIALNRLEEAARLAGKPPPDLQGSHGENIRFLSRARVYARMGKVDEALEILPNFESDIFPTAALHRGWLDAVEALVAAGGLENDGFLDRQVAAICQRLETSGALRLAFWAHESRFRLALLRSRRTTAEDALSELERLAAALERPLDAHDRVAAAKTDLQSCPRVQAELPDTPEEVLGQLSEDPEQTWQILLDAHERWPKDASICSGLAALAWDRPSAKRALKCVQESIALDPEDVHLRILEGKIRLVHFPDEDLEAWAERVSAEGYGTAAHWVLGQRDHQNGQLQSAQSHFERVIDDQPDATNARSALAQVLEASGELEGALARLDELEGLLEASDEDLIWRQLVLSTRLGRWDRVRTLGKNLGMVFDSETGPVDEEWHIVRLEYRAPFTSEAPEVVTGVRTGPVTARVLSMAMPGRPQFYRDEVVFDPRPVDEPDPENEDTDEEEPLTFRVLEVTRPGRMWSFFVLGARPLEADLEALEEKLHALDIAVARASDDEYKIESSEGEERSGLALLCVASEDSAQLGEAAEALKTLAKAVDGPLTWLGLAERLGEKESFETQLALAEAWDLI